MNYLHHFLTVIDAALVKGCQPILVGAVGSHIQPQQPPDLVDVVPGRGLQKHDGGLEVDPGSVGLLGLMTCFLSFQIILSFSLCPSF